MSDPDITVNTHPHNLEPLVLDPYNSTMPVDGAGRRLEAERIVWFANQGPAAATVDGGKVYWNRGPAPLLQPARYAVVGPRPVTRIGWNRKTNDESPQTLELVGGFRWTNTVQVVSQIPAGAQPVLPIIAAANPPPTWRNGNRAIGVSVSEPLPEANYYPEPNPMNDDRLLADAYDDSVAPRGTFLDEPLDASPSRPLGRDGFLATRTKPLYKTAFLERLANPLLPWNPPPLLPDGSPDPHHDRARAVNPYIVVDWIPIDLTVLNGYDAEPAGWDEDDPPGIGPFDPHDPRPPDPRIPPGERWQPWLTSRQRGNATLNNIWERFTEFSLPRQVMPRSDWTITFPTSSNVRWVTHTWDRRAIRVAACRSAHTTATPARLFPG